MMQYPLLAAFPLPVVVSYGIRFQIWWNILSWLRCFLLWLFLIEFVFKYDAISSYGCLASSRGRFLLNSKLNTMNIISLLPFKFKKYPLLAALPPPVVDSYWIPVQIYWNILSWLPCLVLWLFLLSSRSNMMEYPLLAALPPPVVVSNWILIQIGWNILSWLLWLFLIEFSFKYDGICSPGCLASSRGRFLLNSYSNTMKYPLHAT
jgi:hypothetical protein